MQATKAKLGFQDAIGLASRDSNSVLIAQAVVDETAITLSGFGPGGSDPPFLPQKALCLEVARLCGELRHDYQVPSPVDTNPSARARPGAPRFGQVAAAKRQDRLNLVSANSPFRPSILLVDVSAAARATRRTMRTAWPS